MAKRDQDVHFLAECDDFLKVVDLILDCDSRSNLSIACIGIWQREENGLPT